MEQKGISDINLTDRLGLIILIVFKILPFAMEWILKNISHNWNHRYSYDKEEIKRYYSLLMNKRFKRQ